MVILKSWRATQLPCQKRVRGNDYNARLTVSFCLTSLWSGDAFLKGYGEYKKGSGMRMKNSGELSDAAFAFLVERAKNWTP